MCGILLETGFYRFWKLCFRQVSVKRQDKMVVILYIYVYIFISVFKSNNELNVIGMFPVLGVKCTSFVFSELLRRSIRCK